MKKKVLIIKVLLTLLVIVLFIEIISIGVSTYFASRNKIWGLKLSASDVTSTSLLLTMDRKDSERTDSLIIDWGYVIQKRTLFGWKELETIYGNDGHIRVAGLEGDSIEANTSKSWEEKFEIIYGRLGPGVYRIGKRSSIDDYYSYTEQERKELELQQILYATFIVLF